jgi:predicted dehydrogenase
VTPISEMWAVVMGAGSIGRRHMRNLRTLGVSRITAVDPDPERLRVVVEELGVNGASSWKDVRLEQPDGPQPDVVLICTPPSMHHGHCVNAFLSGTHVFVEKPLAVSVKEVGWLLESRHEYGVILQVGYNLRFIPALQALKTLIEEGSLGRPLWARFEAGQYLPDWRPWQDYRQSYTARKELGGGIVFDGSHEIDLALWLLGKPTEVCCMAGHLSDLEMDVEDSATLLLKFESGAQADVHVDCIQREYSRGLKIAFEKGTASWSWPQNVLRIFDVDKGERVIEPPEGYDANQMYLDEMSHFLNDAQEWKDNSVSLLEGREVVRVATAALESAQEKKWISLDAYMPYSGDADFL